MAVSVNRPVTEEYLQAFTLSIGATPAVAYVVAPRKGRIVRSFAVCGGAATGAIAVAVAINGGANIGALNIAAAGAGVAASDTPSGASAGRFFNEGDVISFTPSGGGGANIPGTFVVAIR